MLYKILNFIHDAIIAYFPGQETAVFRLLFSLENDDAGTNEPGKQPQSILELWVIAR